MRLSKILGAMAFLSLVPNVQAENKRPNIILFLEMIWGGRIHLFLFILNPHRLIFVTILPIWKILLPWG